VFELRVDEVFSPDGGDASEG
jgi:hypothetical protein